MNREKALELVANELDWQNEKWKRGDGEWEAPLPTKLAILAEEFGEIAMALNERQWSEMKAELIDVAAVCVAWLMADYQ